MKPNMLSQEKGWVRFPLKIISFIMVKKDIELMNVPKRLVIGEILENLLALRVLFGKKELEPCQRSNLFRTRCKSSGKIYNFIVNGGSTDSLVTKEMV